MSHVAPALLAVGVVGLAACAVSGAQESASTSAPATTPTATQPAAKLSESTLAGLKFRCIGPALNSGRIGDFAVDPTDPSTYYVAVCSGNVWKTTNAGTTFTPIFDDQGSYSIGCVTIDPSNAQTVWVGTGENNSQRSVSFGDGVYVSRDGGKSWENCGLKESEHIGMIAVNPQDSNVVYVAAQGPLWRAGGDRGLYKTADGGKTWTRVLHISDDTGVNEVHLDPRNPDVLYASAYQRRRHVWTLIDGGPESAIYKSTDGGASWQKLTKGLPSVDMGRIGLAIPPKAPDTIYAIIEAAQGKGGVYRSTDRGASWEKRSDYVAGSPQYYNELFPDPSDPDRLYALDTFTHVSNDGGKTFTRLGQDYRHVDDHALWIDPQNSDHLLIGGDGGVYETFDRGETWAHKQNLPLTQFYRLAVDNGAPFYYVYGGTQDNNTVGGPARTKDPGGITNADWFITVGGDGFEPAVDPEDPMIVYSQWQYGGLVRYDRRSGEALDIKPIEKPGEPGYRWNWDSPLMISPHNPRRLYFGANILFRSDDRGNSWTAVSGDLTKQLDRNQLKVFDKIQSVDAVAKNTSTSVYGNLVALDESPLVEGLLYVGTDDGLVQVSEDGGRNWRKIESFPDVPELSYVSDVLASRHDADTVYATFDNHKMGDFKPYVLVSHDRGKSWKSIAGDLPDRQICWALAEDSEVADLLYLGTEYGVFVTLDGGEKWLRLKGGLPTIAVRDLEVQRQANDLVLATFGRGFYVLDDLTPLREMSESKLADNAAVMFPIRDAAWYVPTARLGDYNEGNGFAGSTWYTAKNPPFGAVFTLWLRDKLETRQEQRRKAEEEATKQDQPVRYPSLDELRLEDQERAPRTVLIVRDQQGRTVRELDGPRDSGLHRIAWDLRVASTEPIKLSASGPRSPWDREPEGRLAAPGEYSVALVKVVDGVATELAPPQTFKLVPLNLGTFAADDHAAVAAFQADVAELLRVVRGGQKFLGDLQERLNYAREAVTDTPQADLALLKQVEALQGTLHELDLELNGDATARKQQEATPPSIAERVGVAVQGCWYSTSAPTQTHRDQYRYAAEAYGPLRERLKDADEKLRALEAALEKANAPYTPGRLPEWKPRRG